MKTKIVIATFGSLGDLHPLIALALALKHRGYEPVIATTGLHRSKTEKAGIGFHEVRPDMAELIADLGIDFPDLVHWVMNDQGFIFQKIILPNLAHAYEGMLAAMEGASFVVTHNFALAAKLAAEKRGLPHVNIALAPVHFLSAYDPPMGTPLRFARDPRSSMALAYNRALLWLATRTVSGAAHSFHKFREDLALPKMPGNPFFNAGSGAKAVLGLYSPLLGGPQPDHPAHTIIAGSTLYDKAADDADELQPDLEAFLAAGPAPLLFTLGSFASYGPGDFYTQSIAAARKLNQRAILLMTPEECAQSRHLCSSDILVCGYVPHSLVFSRAAAIIQHGGMGTSGQALRAGKPQLVVPFFGDQPPVFWPASATMRNEPPRS
jgi:UDP:flavonoid glycosyltransferase YjiC (YdhE family)